MFFYKKTEQYYINRLISIDKECWRSRVSEIDCWIKLKKELNKMKLNIYDHPFLYNFREKSAYVNSHYEARELLIELYDYRRYLNNR